MCELWTYNGDDCHIGYKNIRDVRDDENGYYCQKLRQHVAELWEQFKPYADPHFVEEFRRSPDQRYAEMRLGCYLLNEGFSLQTQKKGPDFLFKVDGRKIWIEVVTPTVGQEGSPDRIPDIVANGKAHRVPRDKIILRFRAGLDEKERKFRSYIQGGIVGQGDIQIIALSAGAISPMRTLSGVHPYILSAVFPLGHPYITLERETGEVIGQGNHYQPALTKANGAQVETLFFADPAHSNISAVIYSQADIGNPRLKLGDDLFVIHNPLAVNPLPRGLLPCGREYWAEDKGDSWDLRHEDFTASHESSF